MMAKLGTILVGKGPREPVEGVSLWGVLQVVSEPVSSRKCADEDVGPLRGVDCDDLSGQVRGTGSYLVSNPTSPGWWRKGLKGKRFSSIKVKRAQVGVILGWVTSWEV